MAARRRQVLQDLDTRMVRLTHDVDAYDRKVLAVNRELVAIVMRLSDELAKLQSEVRRLKAAKSETN